MSSDRNFDPIADHFEHKVYGGLKGEIRLAVLARDLAPYINHPTTLNVLDVGAGLAQISLQFAKTHAVTVTDISEIMIQKARASADSQGLSPRFIVGAYQTLGAHLQDQSFDVILCHALLEWLAEPNQIMGFFERYLAVDGVLSLCFYNPASLIYRNLVMGNFYQLDKPRPSDNHSLTPNHPVSLTEVTSWLHSFGFEVIAHSGIRVFYDYSSHSQKDRRGGLGNPQAVIDMELKYSTQEPFWHLGRYLHLLIKRQKA